MLDKKPKKKISIHHALRPACKAKYASLIWSIKADFKILFLNSLQLLYGSGERIKRSKIRKVIASAQLLNASHTDDAIIYRISKQMKGPYHFIEYTKCSYLFPCGKNIIL